MSATCQHCRHPLAPEADLCANCGLPVALQQPATAAVLQLVPRNLALLPLLGRCLVLLGRSAPLLGFWSLVLSVAWLGFLLTASNEVPRTGTLGRQLSGILFAGVAYAWVGTCYTLALDRLQQGRPLRWQQLFVPPGLAGLRCALTLLFCGMVLAVVCLISTILLFLVMGAATPVGVALLLTLILARPALILPVSIFESSLAAGAAEAAMPLTRGRFGQALALAACQVATVWLSIALFRWSLLPLHETLLQNHPRLEVGSLTGQCLGLLAASACSLLPFALAYTGYARLGLPRARGGSAESPRPDSEVEARSCAHVRR